MTDLSSPQDLARGVDVSKNQGVVAWPAVAEAGYAFTFVKATDGQDYVDPMFAQNWEGAQAAGLLRGAYHFFRAEDDPDVQAQWFWKTVGGKNELPLVVDVEESMEQSASTVIANLTRFLDSLQQWTGKPPMIYTDPGFWNGLGTSAFGGYPLWVAEYGVSRAHAAVRLGALGLLAAQRERGGSRYPGPCRSERVQRLAQRAPYGVSHRRLIRRRSSQIPIAPLRIFIAPPPGPPGPRGGPWVPHEFS